MRERSERVIGPYRHRRKWRVFRVAADGRRRPRSFASEREALDYVDEFNKQAAGRTVAEAVKEYLEHVEALGRKASTVTTKRYRLEALLQVADHGSLQLSRLTADRAQRLYDERRAKTRADTHRNELGAAKELGAWCVKQGWLAACPFAGVEPMGQRKKGKLKLRIDEARRFRDTALAEGSFEGLAAALALLMGPRASEVTDRQVRDVDDGGRVFWIERAKTPNGDRALEVPEEIRPLLIALVEGREPLEPLFGDVDRQWLYYHVRRICKKAGVPVVGPQGLRGTAASIGAEAIAVRFVADALGQAGPTVTRQHYLRRGAEQLGQQRARLRVLAGGLS